MIRRSLLVCGLLIAVWVIGATANEIIVVDPGHGGTLRLSFREEVKKCSLAERVELYKYRSGSRRV